ncbi:hypothetical protein ACLB2K_009351 [Fragaria x ananassa]
MPSSYLSKVRTAVQRSIVGHKGVLQDSLDGLIGQGKLLFGNSRLFQSRPFSAVSDMQAFLPQGIVVAARRDNFITHKAFCDALAEESQESAKAQTLGSSQLRTPNPNPNA